MLKKNSVLKFEIISTIMIMILGTILHFEYDWTNNNVIVGIFSPVNESVWEHLKLLFYPMLLMLIIGNFCEGKNVPRYLCAKTLGIIVAISFTIIFYYTYSGIIGKNFAPIDIGSFFVAVILGQYVSYKKMKLNINCNKFLAISTLVSITIFFTIFTFHTPHINIFKDPITNMYGIEKQ